MHGSFRLLGLLSSFFLIGCDSPGVLVKEFGGPDSDTRAIGDNDGPNTDTSSTTGDEEKSSEESDTELASADTGTDTDTDDGGSHPNCTDGATTEGAAETTWVTICGGSFLMGSSESPLSQPIHEVTIPTFEMLKTEVTVGQFRGCWEDGFCEAPVARSESNFDADDRDDHPVNCVNWFQAREICRWLGGRLPSEAEWEYAARSGGQNIIFPWGNTPVTCDYAVFYDEQGVGCGIRSTAPVCSKPAGNTEQGLCDMSGNIEEWIQDGYHDNYIGAPSDGTAWRNPKSDYYVIRGGSYSGGEDYSRASTRRCHYQSYGSSSFGVRCARDLE